MIIQHDILNYKCPPKNGLPGTVEGITFGTLASIVSKFPSPTSLPEQHPCGVQPLLLG